MQVLAYWINGKLAGVCTLDKSRWGGIFDIRSSFEVKGDKVIIPDVIKGVEEFELLEDDVIFSDPDTAERLIELS